MVPNGAPPRPGQGLPELTTLHEQWNERLAYPHYALQWKKRIAGKQLLYLYTSSGAGGGSNEKRTYDLCSNGNFIMAYDNGYTSSNANNDFSAAGSDEGSGTWEVYSLKGQGLLLLRSRSGSITTKTLTDRKSSNEINVDGTKYFVTNVENCR